MAMVCDACGTKFTRDGSGHSNLSVTPPRIDFKALQALISVGKTFEPREHETLDLCLGCTAKALSHLGLPTDICDLPEMPIDIGPPEAPPEAPPAGALTLEDLRALGIDPSAK
jgi:hypothetical protein